MKLLENETVAGVQHATSVIDPTSHRSQGRAVQFCQLQIIPDADILILHVCSIWMELSWKLTDGINVKWLTYIL